MGMVSRQSERRAISRSRQETSALPVCLRLKDPADGMRAVTAQRLDTMTRADRRARLAELYDAHGERVYRLLLRYVRGDRGFAEDLTQEVFVELIERLDRGAAIENVGGWLYRAAVHRALNRLRRDRFLEQPAVRWLLGLQARPARAPDRVELDRAELRRLFAWVNALPDKQRVIVCMHHFDETPQHEIAEILGLSRGYVSKLLARAEATLGGLRNEEDAGP
jgi:RNA polymerase sigma factor (sigma-70 family)